jgi:hypothetical protein
MIHQNVELHNTAEIKDGPHGGVLTQRVPDRVREHLNPGARERVLRPACGEIRFVSEGNTARVTLSAVGGELRVVPFFGRYRHGLPFTIGAEPRTFQIAMPERFISALPALEKLGHPFSPRVCRLMLWGAQLEFHKVEGDGVRPPTADELPALRYLSYGTSITHGSAAAWPHLSYVAQAARRMGADLLNFGVGGSCQCEPEFADYFVERDDWHVATLALSVNMMGFAPDEFRRRVTYAVNTVAGADTSRPVACINLFSYFGDREIDPECHDIPNKADLFREILRQAVAECPHPNATIFEGREILADYEGLTTDLIHPADDAMIQMGENIARRLLPRIAARR